MGRRGTVLAPIDTRTLASTTSSASSWNEVRHFSPLSIAIRELLICFSGSLGIRLVPTDKTSRNIDLRLWAEAAVNAQRSRQKRHRGAGYSKRRQYLVADGRN